VRVLALVVGFLIGTLIGLAGFFEGVRRHGLL
jgi:hypothetical protein